MRRDCTRRTVLAALAGALAGCGGQNGRTGGSTAGGGTGGSGTAGGGSGTAAQGTVTLPDAVGVERVAAGFDAPVGVEFPAGVDGRAYVVDQSGRVTVVRDGERSTFLDVRDRMVSLDGYDERGLLGLAFHPDFPDAGRCFVRYSAPPREGTPDGYSHTFVLSEFAATPDAADPASERPLLEIPEPQSNHDAGAVAFGPDGHLYVGVGDGGGANDSGPGHVEDWYEAVPGGNGQDVTANLLGSVLRIDVDGESGDRPYGVPDDNPLVGREGLDEQYAWGLRNPWRFSFDPAGSRIDGAPDLYVADVGQNRYEEVSLVGKGWNMGWNVREGTHCFRADDCPSETPDGDPLRPPIVEYAHDGDDVNGVAVIGGYRYRGDALSLAGAYVFADWRAQGRLFVATPAETGLWPATPVPLDGSVGQYVLGFGRDPTGELYVCTSDRGSPSGGTGAVHRLVPA
ncbi:MAG: sorbosone dehydrogenase family protein [Haloferacaceae archaeon]